MCDSPFVVKLYETYNGEQSLYLLLELALGGELYRATNGSYRAKKLQKTENQVFHKNCFFHYFKWNWGGLGVSRVTARTVRRRMDKFSADLVVHDIRKSTFRKYWNFNVLEMVLKTFHFVPGLSRTPLLFIPRYLANIIFENMCQKKISRIELLKI